MTGFGRKQGREGARGSDLPPAEAARAAALRLLARREHSRREIALKLAQRGLAASDYDAVLDEFEERGWLSDERYAEMLVRHRLESGYGPLRIRADLQQKGIREIPPSLSAISERDWRQAAVDARARRFGLEQLEGDRKLWAKQAGYLARRGFSGDQIEYALSWREPDDVKGN